METKLAIIIPAYKPEFLSKALTSICSQSCKKFNLYIGDDCSPYDLSSIVNQFNNGKINLKYKRFAINVGGQDLVAQWERCISLTQGEEWIWIFSDDDVMGERCVEKFFQELDRTQHSYDIYHFNVQVIDKWENVQKKSLYPDVISANAFYKWKAEAKIESFVVENIFSKEIYDQIGGFSKFPLAWGSDTLTWMRMMENKGMKTIPDEFVYWRSSNVNITPNRNKKISLVKALADVELMSKAESLLGKSIHGFNIRYFFRMLVHYCDDIGFTGYKDMVQKAYLQKTINKIVAMFAYSCYPICKLIKYIRR